MLNKIRNFFNQTPEIKNKEPNKELHIKEKSITFAEKTINKLLDFSKTLQNTVFSKEFYSQTATKVSDKYFDTFLPKAKQTKLNLKNRVSNTTNKLLETPVVIKVIGLMQKAIDGMASIQGHIGAGLEKLKGRFSIRKKDELQIDGNRRKSLSDPQIEQQFSQLKSKERELIFREVISALESDYKLRVNGDKFTSKSRRPTKINAKRIKEHIGKGLPGTSEKSQASANKLIEIIKEESKKLGMKFEHFKVLNILMQKLEKNGWFQEVLKHNDKIKTSFEEAKIEFKKLESSESIKEIIDKDLYITLEDMLEKAMYPNEKPFRKTFVLCCQNYFSLSDILTHINETFMKEDSVDKQPPWMQLAYDILNASSSSQIEDATQEKNDLEGIAEVYFPSIPFENLNNEIVTNSDGEESLSSKIDTIVAGKLKEGEYTQFVNDFVQDLTTHTSQLFQSLKAGEFTEHARSEKNRSTESPNIGIISKQFNATSNHAVQMILKGENTIERSNMIKFYIQVAEKLIEKNNYSDAMAIFACLNNSSITRLKNTFAKLPNKYQKKIVYIQDILTGGANSKNIRERIQTNIDNNVAYIPYLGTFLSDLTFAFESTKEKDEKYNVNRFKILGGIVEKILGGQTTEIQSENGKLKYNLLKEFEKVDEIEDFENKMYHKSLELEPRKKTA